MKDKPVIIDGKRTINHFEAEKMGFIYFGVGYQKVSSSRLSNYSN
jgi:hypothetical protein